MRNKHHEHAEQFLAQAVEKSLFNLPVESHIFQTLKESLCHATSFSCLPAATLTERITATRR
jgi:hypothetical protein